MKKIPATFLFIALSLQALAQNPLPGVAGGKIERVAQFQSKYVTARNIDIWLPEGYPGAGKYAVWYMHDGQMLYDPSQTRNQQAWDIDDVAGQLMEENKARDVIVVGIWNGGQTRHQDYFPQKPFERLTQIEKDTVIAQLQRTGRTKDVFRPQSDNYLKFIVKELKPYIDRTYATHTDRQNTFIAGSSMGGLISLYALCEYPKIFGGAACISTHWVGTFSLENNPVPQAFLGYLDAKLPDPNNHKLYFDCGDQALDALYPAIQAKVDALMKSKGYSDRNWLTRYFPGEDHSERAWKKRLHIPLEFLLGK
ncbi:MAG: alpha/beta hydrolase [Saprospiraceae bacterium]